MRHLIFHRARTDAAGRARHHTARQAAPGARQRAHSSRRRRGTYRTEPGDGGGAGANRRGLRRGRDRQRLQDARSSDSSGSGRSIRPCARASGHARRCSTAAASMHRSIIVERWWRDERKAFQIASAFGRGTRLSLDVLSELRLMLRLMRFKQHGGGLRGRPRRSVWSPTTAIAAE